jgi:hypothetical protein
MRCDVCGGVYVLIDGLCGECLLVVNGEWPDAPQPEHEPVYDEAHGSLRYLPGFVEARDHLTRIGSVLASARAAREEARARPLAPVVRGRW